MEAGKTKLRKLAYNIELPEICLLPNPSKRFAIIHSS
jgi:hypothetical protein